MPRARKKTVAATQPGPNTVSSITGANIKVRIGAARWSRQGTIRDTAPIRRIDLVETIRSTRYRIAGDVLLRDRIGSDVSQLTG